ncbi:MAG: hypothetical protein ABIG63_01390 [Chloroflexota bacterium]
MSITEEMIIDEHRKYLHKMKGRYWKAKSKKEKSQLLDEMEAVTKLHRKSVIRLTHGELARQSRRRQRQRTYGVEVDSALWVNPWLLCCAPPTSVYARLRVSDILSDQGQIRVRGGKGKKDRYTTLADKSIPILREYYRVHQPME